MAATKTTSPKTFWERRQWLRSLDLPSSTKFVLLTLHDYAGDQEWAFPHQSTPGATGEGTRSPVVLH